MGLHCASCVTIVSKELLKISGVKSAEINLAAEKARIDFDEAQVSLQSMNEKISKLGYHLMTKDMIMGESGNMDHSEHLGLNQTQNQKLLDLKKQKNKLSFALPPAAAIFLLMVWDISTKIFPELPRFSVPMEILNPVEMIIATIMLFWIGTPFLKGIVRFIRYRVADMDTLIGIGTATAYFYSLLATLFPILRTTFHLPEYTYFDVTIVVIGFVVLGKYLEAKSKIKTGEAIEKLLGLQAKFALIFRSNQEIEIPVSEVVVGDIVIVKPGAKIPVDGVIVEGQSSIDESMVTGESMPNDKKIGDVVIGSTINKLGAFKFRAIKVGSETMLAQIIRMVEEAQGSKAPIQKIADKISGVFVPTVLIIAVISLIVWLTAGASILGSTAAISYGIMALVGTLVIACPCALGLATPTAIIVGIGKGAKYGILIKNAESLEKLAAIDTIVFDKTGTITKGSPEISDIVILAQEKNENDILQIAASAEKMSEHPLARSIVEEAQKRQITLKDGKNFLATEGLGIQVTIDNVAVRVRKPNQKEFENKKIQSLQKQGKTVVIVEIDNKNIGLIALSDVVKEDVKKTISELRKKNI